LEQVFARKVININASGREHIKREADIMSELASVGRTENLNIITIMRHGRLQGVARYYFIDMELGSFTLEDYIRWHFGFTDLDIDWPVYTKERSIVERNCSPIARLENWCTIGLHIASGLKYMHSHRYVHRDLKPANGIQHLSKSNKVVLYFLRENLWKLTDFGISGQTRTSGVTTALSRGTPSYRAPELYDEPARFTDKVDMWALGCVVYECITGLKAFSGDYAVAAYSEENAPPFSVPSRIWDHLLGSMIQRLLRRDEANRPTAANIEDIFASYRRILVSPIGESLLNCTAHPSYEEWSILREMHPSEHDWLYELAADFKGRGEENVSTVLLEETVTQFLDIIERLHDKNSNVNELKPFTEDPRLANTRTLFAKLLDYIPEWLLPWVCYEIGKYLSSESMNESEVAISICRCGMKKSPQNIILPMLVSNLYAEEGRYYDAVLAEEAGFHLYSDISLATLESTLLGFHARILKKKIGYIEEISRALTMYVSKSFVG